MKSEITSVKIVPGRVKHGRSETLAKGEAVFNEALVVGFKICEGKKGIYCLWMGVTFETPEARKEASNRVLATYVVNHCCDDYTV
jgi:hypothetical protein